MKVVTAHAIEDKFRRLEDHLKTLACGDLPRARALSFVELYDLAYNLAIWGQNRRLFQLFNNVIERLANSRIERDVFDISVAMLCDVFLFPIGRRFGGYARGGFDVHVLADELWESRHALRPRTRS